MPVSNSGSVRVDLVGGTIDLFPLNMILKDVLTLNVATHLKAKTEVSKISEDKIKILSKDYNRTYEFELKDIQTDFIELNQFEEMTFILEIIKYFKPSHGLEISLQSGAPAGSGLGGSSTMGVTLFKALCELFSCDFDAKKAIKVIMSIEGKILNKGMPGYQDYYPALFGGLLCLKPNYDDVEVEQLFEKDLCEFLEKRITLAYSGKSRLSGINNWEVYKNFFDGNTQTVSGLQEIAEISQAAYQAIKEKNYELLLELVAKEGEARESLFPNIVSKEIKDLVVGIKIDLPGIGLKMCGAGGGGCFILIHGAQDAKIIEDHLKKANMQSLGFEISNPIV